MTNIPGTRLYTYLRTQLNRSPNSTPYLGFLKHFDSTHLFLLLRIKVEVIVLVEKVPHFHVHIHMHNLKSQYVIVELSNNRLCPTNLEQNLSVSSVSLSLLNWSLKSIWIFHLFSILNRSLWRTLSSIPSLSSTNSSSGF